MRLAPLLLAVLVLASCDTSTEPLPPLVLRVTAQAEDGSQAEVATLDVPASRVLGPNATVGVDIPVRATGARIRAGIEATDSVVVGLAIRPALFDVYDPPRIELLSRFRPQVDIARGTGGDLGTLLVLSAEPLWTDGPESLTLTVQTGANQKTVPLRRSDLAVPPTATLTPEALDLSALPGVEQEQAAPVRLGFSLEGAPRGLAVAAFLVRRVPPADGGGQSVQSVLLAPSLGDAGAYRAQPTLAFVPQGEQASGDATSADEVEILVVAVRRP